MKETNSQTESSEAGVSVGRRAFIKLTAVGAGISTASIGSITVTGNVRATDGLSARTHGGQIVEFDIDGTDEFDIEWDEMPSRGTLELGLEVETTDEDDVALLGERQLIVSESEGTETVKIEDFFDDNGKIPLFAHHPIIESDDVSVDLDKHDPNDDYRRETTFELTVTSAHTGSRSVGGGPDRSRRAPGGVSSRRGPGDNTGAGVSRRRNNGNGGNSQASNDPTVAKVFDSETITFTIEIVAILGCGIYFGKEFGVTNPDDPSKRPVETLF